MNGIFEFGTTVITSCVIAVNIKVGRSLTVTSGQFFSILLCCRELIRRHRCAIFFPGHFISKNLETSVVIFSSVSAIDSQAALYACACIDVFSVDAGDVFMERSGDRWLHHHFPRCSRRRLPLQRSPLVSHARHRLTQCLVVFCQPTASFT